MLYNNIINAANISVEDVAQRLKQDQIIALPTETVYGLAACADSDTAVERIYVAKNRPYYNPLIIHMCNIAMVESYCIIDELSYYLMEHFWPGPLTLVLPLKKQHQLSHKVTSGLNTIAVRIPRGLFRDVIEKCNRPIAAPSANKSGSISPTSALDVAESLKDNVSLIVDGGICEVGLESTIIKLEGERLRILRPGGVTQEELAAKLLLFNAKTLGVPILLCGEGPNKAIEAPGMLSSHYAPSSLLRLNAQELKDREVLLAFAQQSCYNINKASYVLNLSERGDLREAAANLFSYLKRLDQYKARAIAVQPIPMHGLGVAINDRLARAAAPRC